MGRRIILVGMLMGMTVSVGIRLVAQQSASPTPALPADVPKDADIRLLINDVTPSGQEAVWRDSTGVLHVFYQYNDRGRGPKTYTTCQLDAAGIIVAEHTSGVDYMKNPVEATFALAGGQARWKNQSEDQTVAGAAGKFYLALNEGNESMAQLVRAALRNSGHIALLPAGDANIRKLQTIAVEGTDAKINATLYQITGLSFAPSYVWLDGNLRFFASTPGWLNAVRQGFEPSLKALRESQQSVEQARAAELARTLTHATTGDLIIKNVSVFDSITGDARANQRITVRSGHIAAIEDERGQPTPGKSTVLDGSGKMALPGLWDMHQHISPDNAVLDVAAGITTVRDLGNPPDSLTKLYESIPERQIGPRILRAGFIDGRGPFQGPISVYADTPEEAIAQVKKYGEAGYVQIKVYSSLKPELVPIIAAEAHKRGMRLSGHVPATMIAQQFVEAGADEIQHINMVMLNFWPDVKETRNPQRFIVPGQRSASLDLDSEAVTRFIQFLKEHKTVIDPTLEVFEDTFVSRPGKVPASDAPMIDRLPAQVQRALKTGSDGLPVKDEETDRLYRASYAKMLAMVKKLFDAGVPIVAGTDQQYGYTLHRELELYVEAGIPPAQTLRLATIVPATVMKRQDELGSITAGKIADIILVNGDPTKRISDIRKIDTVIQSGNILHPAELYPAMSIRPN